MTEILRSNVRVSRTGDYTVAAVAAVALTATASAPALWVLTHLVWLAVAAPSALIIAATVASVVIQRRAARRHAELCGTVTGR
jgi:cation transport ATPase